MDMYIIENIPTIKFLRQDDGTRLIILDREDYPGDITIPGEYELESILADATDDWDQNCYHTYYHLAAEEWTRVKTEVNKWRRKYADKWRPTIYDCDTGLYWYPESVPYKYKAKP
jgi:hypothetical protein